MCRTNREALEGGRRPGADRGGPPIGSRLAIGGWKKGGAVIGVEQGGRGRHLGACHGWRRSPVQSAISNPTATAAGNQQPASRNPVQYPAARWIRGHGIERRRMEAGGGAAGGHLKRKGSGAPAIGSQCRRKAGRSGAGRCPRDVLAAWRLLHGISRCGRARECALSCRGAEGRRQTAARTRAYTGIGVRDAAQPRPAAGAPCRVLRSAAVQPRAAVPPRRRAAV